VSIACRDCRGVRRCTDADADGFGRSLRFQPESKGGGGTWETAISAAPLSELAGSSSEFSWAVRVDEWDKSALMAGVIHADAECMTRGYALVHGHSLCMHGNTAPRRSWTSDDRADAYAQQPMPPLEKDTVLQVRVTADLQANTVRFAGACALCDGRRGGGGGAEGIAAD
jgi:hypothetical protein